MVKHKSRDYKISAGEYYFYNAYKLKGNIKLYRKPSTQRRKLKHYRKLLYYDNDHKSIELN